MTSDDACGLENRWALAEWQRGKKVPRVVCARSRRDLDLRTTDCTYRRYTTRRLRAYLFFSASEGENTVSESGDPVQAID